MSKLDHHSGSTGRSEYGDAILLKLPCTMQETQPVYHYVWIGGQCTPFQLSQPVTRFFANIANNHAQQSVALTADDALFLRGVPLRVPRDVLLREPWSAMNPLPTNAEWHEEHGEKAFELFMLRTGGDWHGATGDVHLLRPEDASLPGADRYPTVHQDHPINSRSEGDILEEQRQIVERMMRFQGWGNEF